MSAERLPLVSRDSRSNLLRAFKATGCCACGRRYPEVDWPDLHIHHVDPRMKVRMRSSIAQATGGGSAGHHGGAIARLLAELIVCQVLCADCHKRTHRSGLGPLDEQLALFDGSGAWRYPFHEEAS